MKKRVFSALLCLVMVIGFLPGIALADQKAAPEAPAATQIPTQYMVYCEKHGAKPVSLIWDTFEIGDVAEKDGQYICPITIETAEYAKAYSTEHGEHAALAEKVTFNMKWDGLKWRDPVMTEMPMVELACVPEAPAETAIPMEYIVSCGEHPAMQMNLLPDTLTIGDVAMVDGKFVCPITIETAPYAEEYSKEHGEHAAVAKEISFNMKWDGLKWIEPAMTELPEINLECVVPAAPAANELPMGYMVKCNQGRIFHGARFIYQQPESFTIGEVEKVGDTYVCTVTVGTEQYAKAYSNCWGIRKTHTAVDKTISFTMTWDGEQWVAPAYTELPVINVACARTNSWFPVNFHWLKW